MAIKGAFGTRPDIKASEGKIKGGGRLWIVGVDGVKTQIFSRLQRGQGIKFSSSLEPVYYRAARQRAPRCALQEGPAGSQI